ncbi:hypothetical protein RIF29_28679 [Crotalaria pallida]|uniref:Uncharacterized protein n=1 Tax=Crotalaria pallida TaxID=3830 RepID=A0AAN9ED36_CROPI
MYPSLSPRKKKVDLRIDDVEGVQALYGSNPNFTFGSLLQSENSSNDVVGSETAFSTWILTLAIGLFWPGKRAADAITLTLKQGWHYKEPVYGKLKKEQKDELFERFRPKIRKLFNSSMSSRIRNTFAEARKKNVRPNWLQVDIWECLCAHWQTDEYKRIQEVDKANRAS